MQNAIPIALCKESLLEHYKCICIAKDFLASKVLFPAFADFESFSNDLMLCSMREIKLH